MNSIQNINLQEIEDYKRETLTVTVESNKLRLSEEAVKLLDAVAGDRIAINYWTQNSECTFPVIGKSEVFTDKNDGNRLTKSNTVSFRGIQNEILLEYGEFFKLEPFKEFFKMIPISKPTDNDDLSEEESDLNKLEDKFN